MKRLGTGVALILTLAGCESVSDVALINLSSEGVLTGTVYTDLNGSGALDGGDEPLDSASVALGVPGDPSALARGMTDSTGAFAFRQLTPGQYEVRVESDVLGDSLVISERSPNLVTISPGEGGTMVIGVAFPTIGLVEVFSAPVGRRVFTHGTALNERHPAGDGVVHFAEGSNYLRTVNVERSDVGPGDSTKVLGRIADGGFGRQVLEDVTPIVLIPNASIPLPQPVSTEQGRLAGGGGLDAALVSVQDALIEAVTDLGGGDFRLRVDDGTGDLEVEVPLFVGADPADLVAGNVLRSGVGLLRPFAASSFRLHPRTASDLQIESPGS